MSAKADIWMPLYIGDYLRDTTRLTTAQHGAYMLLIMDYWTNGAPPDDDAVLASITKSTPEDWAKIRAAIASKFQIEGGVWRHSRIDHELAEAQDNKQKRLERSYKANLAKAAKATSKDTLKDAVEVTPSPSPSPSPNKSSSSKKIVDDVVEKPVDVQDYVWISYLALRRKLKKPLTSLAMDRNRREAKRAGLSMDEALTFCCELAWQAFNADWYVNHQERNKPVRPRQQTESFYERDQRLKRQEAAKWGGAPTDDFMTIDAEVQHVPAIEGD